MTSLDNVPADVGSAPSLPNAPTVTGYCPRCGQPVTGGRFCSACGGDLASAVQSTAQPTRTLPWGGMVVIIGGALAVLGSFLPWISVTAPLVGGVSRSGMDGGGDGIITLVIGMILALVGVAIVARTGRLRLAVAGAIGLSLILGLTALIDMSDVSVRGILLKTQLRLDNNLFADAVTVTVGMGLYVVLIGAVVGLVGAVITLVRSRRADVPQPS